MKTTKTSFGEAQKATSTFSRQGLSGKEIAKRTEDALNLARISGIDAETAAKTPNQTIRSFSKEGLKL